MKKNLDKGIKIGGKLFGMIETDGGDGYTTLWMSLMPLNCTLKND